MLSSVSLIVTSFFDFFPGFDATIKQEKPSFCAAMQRYSTTVYRRSVFLVFASVQEFGMCV